MVHRFGIVLLVALSAFLNWVCGTRTALDPEQIARSRTSYAGLSDTARYVGMNTCMGCHSGIHETFRHTGMGMSFDRATTVKSAAEFNAGSTVYDKQKDLFYHPFWKDDSLFFSEFRLNGKDTIHQRREHVAYVVGSGQHTNSHILDRNGYLFQAPLTYYTQKGKWDLPPGFEQGNNSRFNRSIGLECMSCHNAYPEFVVGSSNKYNLVPSGIDCERCHGPGSIHVREKSMGILIDTAKAIDYSIVNPAKLPIDLQFDVCQRCHVQGNAVLREGKSFLDFKPGMRLSEVMNIYMPVYDDDGEQHIMASHAERLKMSKCFIESAPSSRSESEALRPYKNALTCITCHNPHVSVKKSGRNLFNAACMDCHGKKVKSLCTEKSVLRTKSGDDCVSCHMPLHGTVDIPHVSVHDHRIGIHRMDAGDESGAIRKLKGIICVHDSDPPRESTGEAYVNYVEKFGFSISLLDSALKYIPHHTKDEKRKQFHSLVRIAFLKRDVQSLNQLLSELPDIRKGLNRMDPENRDAWTSYRIGELLLVDGTTNPGKGDARDPLPWFENAYKLAPLDPAFANKYATLLVNAGRANEAGKIWEFMVKEHPNYAPGFCNLGYLVLQRDRNTVRAHQLIDRSIALDPDYEQSYMNKAAVCIQEGDLMEAERLLNVVMVKNPRQEQARRALAAIRSERKLR